MLISMVLLLFLLSIAYEWVRFLKHSGKKLKVLHLSIMLVSFCVLILYSLDVPLPSPNDMIMNVLEPILKLKG